MDFDTVSFLMIIKKMKQEMLKAFAPACMTQPVTVGPLQEHQPQYCLSLFPSHRDQAKTSSFEVQLNVELPLSQRQMQLLFWAPIKLHHVCHEMLYYTCPCPNSALQTVRPVRPDTVTVLLQ